MLEPGRIDLVSNHGDFEQGGGHSLALYYPRFFLNDTAPTGIYTRPYTLSLHDALPISARSPLRAARAAAPARPRPWPRLPGSSWRRDRKSTRLNSSHTVLSRMPSS